MQIVSKEEAINQGLNKFFTGVPCRNNHITTRDVSKGRCDECRKDSYKKHGNPKRDAGVAARREAERTYFDSHPDLVSRKQAKEMNLTRYFTGKPCVNGHVSERTVSKAMCIDCKREEYTRNRETYLDYNHRKYENNKDQILANQKIYYEANKDVILKKNIRYYYKNRNEIIDSRKKYWLNMPEEKKAKVRKYKRDWISSVYEEGGERLSAHKARRNYIVSKRRKQLQHASYDIFEGEILQIYLNAQIEKSKLNDCVETDETLDLQVHVDHIVPLQNNLVCGLHIPCNLQLMDARENRAKCNSFIPYWEDHLTGEIKYVS
jgi:hypothetical protein